MLSDPGNLMTPVSMYRVATRGKQNIREIMKNLYNNGANDLDWFTISSLISIGIALKIAHSIDIHITLQLMYVMYANIIAVLGD
jgi:hypothetical protein